MLDNSKKWWDFFDELYDEEIQLFVQNTVPKIFSWYLKRNTSLQASDIVQEIHLKVCTSYNSFNWDKDQLKKWLYTIMINYNKELFRKLSKTQSVYETLSIESVDHWLGSVAHWAIQHITFQKLWDLLKGSLTEKQYSVFYQKIIMGASFKKIAETSSLAQSTIKSRYYKTLTHLKGLPELQQAWKELRE
jgi:RNA polymerase sigma factor (sigma-70 family)